MCTILAVVAQTYSNYQPAKGLITSNERECNSFTVVIVKQETPPVRPQEAYHQLRRLSGGGGGTPALSEGMGRERYPALSGSEGGRGGVPLSCPGYPIHLPPC